MKMTLGKIDKEACRGYYKVSVLGSQCGRECLTSCPVGRPSKSDDQQAG